MKAEHLFAPVFQKLFVFCTEVVPEAERATVAVVITWLESEGFRSERLRERHGVDNRNSRP